MSDILRLEALIQLTMWRHGKRTSVLPMEPEVEKKHHKWALDKLAEGNWWVDVVERRTMMIKKKKETEPARSGRTRGGRV